MKNKEVEKGLFAASGFYLLAAFGLVLFSFAAVNIGPFLSRIFPGISQEWMTLLMNLLYYGAFILVPVALWAHKRPDAVEWLRLNPISLGATVRLALVALLSVTVTYNLTLVWTALWQKLGLNVFVDVYIRPSNTAELMRSVISAAVVAGVSEELLFRGVMLTAWENCGAKKAMWITALLFTLLHGSLLGFPAELLCGAVLALAVRWTNSLYAGMIFHSTYNAALVILNYVSSDPALGETTAGTSDLFQSIGGLGGVVALLAEAAFFIVLVWALMQKFRMLYQLRKRAARAVNHAAANQMIQRMRRAQLTGEDEPESPAVLSEQLLLLQKNAENPQPDAETHTVCTEPLSAGILVLIMAGVLSALVLYGLNLLSMLA